MTTTITKTVGTATGRDYATFTAAIAGLPSDLTAVDQAWILEFYNDPTPFPTGAFTLTGKTTDATRTITCRPAAGQGFANNASKNSNALTYDATKGVAFAGSSIALDTKNTVIQGLQFSNYAIAGSFGSNADSTSHFMGCIFTSTDTPTGEGSVTSGGAGLFINCLIINTAGGNGAIDSASAQYRNCTFVAPSGGTTGRYGLRGNYSAPLMLNCESFGYTTDFAQTSNASNDYNMGDGTNAPGAHSLKSKVFANQFVNPATDFRRKVGSDAIGVGTPDIAHTGGVDILGNPRSATAPSIGAIELAPVVLTVAGTAGNGTVGMPYSAQFTASGGSAPYTYSVGSGALPAGTALNASTGLVSGTPTTAGTSNFTIHAVDSGS